VVNVKIVAPFAGRTGRVVAGFASLVLVLFASRAATAAGVVGNGSPGSCTEGALNTALAGGGSVTFNCGGSPVVIPITAQKVISVATTVDGGSADLVILDAGGATRHFTTSQNIPLTVRNLTLRNGRCPVPDPGQPSPGYGGSIRSGILSPLTITDSRFINNVCDVAGVDVGGGAIRQRRGVLVVQRTLFSGNRAGNAGGISVSDSPTTVEDSTFTGNTTNAHSTGFSGVGGGFYVDGAGGGQIVLRRNVFTGNTATFQAGAVQTFFYPPDQGLLVEDCVFQNNSAPDAAGALLHQAGRLTMTRTTFTGNVSGRDAGAVMLYLAAQTAISDSTFSANRAVRLAGGLWLVDSNPVTVTNSTFSGNRVEGTSSSGQGGAMSVGGTSAVTVSHTTFADNFSSFVGGGIEGANVTLRASVFSNNTSGIGFGRHCTPQAAEGGFNVQFPAQNPGSGDPNCTSGVLIADPLLGPLANNGGPTQTRALTGASPARDRVTSGCPPPSTDQRGSPRPIGAGCDSGSYEASGSIAVADTAVTEGTGSAAQATFTLTLTPAATSAVTVQYFTANGTATTPADYTAAAGVVTFPAGVTSRTVNVSVAGDALDEDNETFTLNLSGAAGAAIADGQAVGTITDDDPAPSVSVGDCAVPEGDGGGTACAFVATLSAASARSISVGFATSSGSATSGSDFTAASGTLAFAPGAQSATANVVVLGDGTDETDESFTLTLSAPVNATLGDATGSGSIDDDDGPLVRIADTATVEGNAGSSNASFSVTLSASSPQTVLVPYQTSEGTAGAGSDYTTAGGTLTFPPGTLARTATVAVLGDTTDEPNERFYVNLGSPVDAFVADRSGAGTIVDDDAGAFPLRELSHGADQREDLSTGADLFALTQPGYSSWEVVVEGSSGDLGAAGPTVERLDGDLSTVVQASSAIGPGFARSLRWQNAASTQQENYVRVRSTQCSPCGADDVYRIRVYETTYAVPRFNNGGGQATVLVLQNPTGAAIAGTAYFWSPDGALLGMLPFNLAARSTLSQNTTSIAGLGGVSGSITVVHGARYGELAGKAVSVDPANGFTFDSLMVPRRR
jgi:hypothetical protein